MTAESPGDTLDATPLVQEAYLRLVGGQQFDGRGHFFAAAAQAMRRVLVNHARDRGRPKRASGRVRVEQLDPDPVPGRGPPDLVLSLDERSGRADP
jgi:DNA-directed RNA polymerase specialized sigma24 family protein